MKPRTPCTGCPCLSDPWDGAPECRLGYPVGDYLQQARKQSTYFVGSEDCGLYCVTHMKDGVEVRFCRPAPVMSVGLDELPAVQEPATPADALLRDAARRIADEVCERLLAEPAWVGLVKHEEPR